MGDIQQDDVVLETERSAARLASDNIPRHRKLPSANLCLQIFTAIFVFIAVVMVGASLSDKEKNECDFPQSMVTKINTIHSQSGQMMPKLNELKSEIDEVEEEVDEVEEKLESLDDKLDKMNLTLFLNDRILLNYAIHKYQVPHLTPVKATHFQGTTWEFTTMSILEQSYRRQGIQRGWLNSTAYVELSEQAYGAEIIKFCKANPAQCDDGDGDVDDIVRNNTAQGYALWIGKFRGIGDKVFPHSICPYLRSHKFFSDDLGAQCPGLAAAEVTNPLNFTLHRKSLYTVYDRFVMRWALRFVETPLAFNMAFVGVKYYLPCIGLVGMYNDQCKPGERDTASNSTCKVLCPAAVASQAECCAEMILPSWNLEGEFFGKNSAPNAGEFVEYGRASLSLVGYNDAFRTLAGETGGFILKSNWGPAVSHSLDFWMEEISREDEMEQCPNHLDPRTWKPCSANSSAFNSTAWKTNDFTLLDLNEFVRGDNPDDGGRFCVHSAKCSSLQKDVNVCIRQFNTTEGPDFGKITFEGCFDDLPYDAMGEFFKPVSFVHNDPGKCGYYFFPYNIMATEGRQFGSPWASYFNVTWEPSSYLANRAQYPSRDYQYVEASTKNVNNCAFPGPTPQFSNDESVNPYHIDAPICHFANNRNNPTNKQFRTRPHFC